MWLEGSWATGLNNDQSDIDVWLDVDEGTFIESIELFREAVMTIGAIDWERSRGVYSQDPRLQKHTFHLAGYPESQCIELDLQEHQRRFVFHRDEHVIVVIFDKDQTIIWDR